jgi:hypothetical protein
MLLSPLRRSAAAHHTLHAHILPAFEAFQTDWAWCDQDLLNHVYKAHAPSHALSPSPPASAAAGATASGGGGAPPSVTTTRLHTLHWRFNAQKRMFVYARTQWNSHLPSQPAATAAPCAASVVAVDHKTLTTTAPAITADESIALVHFVGGKPWHSEPQRRAYDYEPNTAYEPLFEVWRAAFDGRFPLKLPSAPSCAAANASAPT